MHSKNNIIRIPNSHKFVIYKKHAHVSYFFYFQRYRSDINNKYMFVSVLSGVILNSTFGIIDVLLAPHDLLVSRLIIIRFGIIVPISLILLFIVRFVHKKLGRWIHLIACLLAGLSGAGVLACACFAHAQIPQSIFSTQYALVIMYTFLLIHIRFVYPLDFFKILYLYFDP
jgi:hypothetical protein